MLSSLFEIEQAKSNQVCPVCLKKCGLFKRLIVYKWTDGPLWDNASLSHHIFYWHRPVCKRCKCLKCRTWKDGTSCQDRPAKKLSKGKALPAWWDQQTTILSASVPRSWRPSAAK